MRAQCTTHYPELVVYGATFRLNGTSARIFNFNYQIVLHPPLGTIRYSISPCILERLFTNTYQRISSRIWINFGFNFSSWFSIQKLIYSSVRVNAANVCGFELNWMAVTILIELQQWIILCWLYWLWVEDSNSKSKSEILKPKSSIWLDSIAPAVANGKTNTVFYILNENRSRPCNVATDIQNWIWMQMQPIQFTFYHMIRELNVLVNGKC